MVKKFNHPAKISELYLTYTESRSGGQPLDPDSAWSSRTEEIIEFYPTGLFLKKGAWQEIVDVPFQAKDFLDKTIYVVIARYYDGSSFGRISGLWQVVAATPDSQVAQDIAKNIYQDRDTLLSTLEQHICLSFYPNWYGYFAGLQEVEVHTFKLQDAQPSLGDYDGYNQPKIKWVNH